VIPLSRAIAIGAFAPAVLFGGTVSRLPVKPQNAPGNRGDGTIGPKRWQVLTPLIAYEAKGAPVRSPGGLR
jgi:hypothetical protein